MKRALLRIPALCLLAGTLIAVVTGESQGATAQRRPSVLVVSPDGTGGLVGSYFLDLQYLRDLKAQGWEPDFTDSDSEFTWERVKDYNVIVIYNCPPRQMGPKGRRTVATSKDAPQHADWIATVERFLEAGGGVFLMAHTYNPDEQVRPMIEPWGARLPREYYVEEDGAGIAPMPRMRRAPMEHISLTRQVLPSPISEGVNQLWLPYGRHWAVSTSHPLAVDDNWTVVVRGSKTSRTVPVPDGRVGELGYEPAEPLVRPEGVDAPPLIAIREYRNGRIWLACQHPQFSIGQGTMWLYDRVVLEKGVQGIPSDYGRLLLNALRWLAAPSLESGTVGGFRTPDGRLDWPNFKPEVRKRFEEQFWSEEELNQHRPPIGGNVYRGLIGARTAFSSGTGTVAEYAAAARLAGLDFLVFMDDFPALTKAELRRMDELCRSHSDDSLLLLPGYSVPANTGNHLFFYGYGLPWPEGDRLAGPDFQRLNLQYQDADGNYVQGKGIIDWFLKDFNRFGRQGPDRHNIGYYDFRDPNALQMYDLRLYAAAAVFFWENGQWVEDRTADYLLTAAGQLPPSPMAVNIVASPADLLREAAAGRGLTFAQATSRAALPAHGLSFTGQLSAQNVFPSTGPIIHAWPECRRYITFACEPFVAGQALLPSLMHVTAEHGLEEVSLYNGERLFRRFRPGGASEFKQRIQIPTHLQQTLVMVATDTRGGKAVSFARRTWKFGDPYVSFLGDHVNSMYLSRGPGGMLKSNHAPKLLGGATWDGGPLGDFPVCHFGANQPVIVSDAGSEPPVQYNNIPIVESGDHQALVVRSVLDRFFAPDVPRGREWIVFGPLEANRLIRSERRYIEYNNPILHVQRVGYPHWAEFAGAIVSCFENSITFLRDQTVRELRLLQSSHPTPLRPVLLAVSDGDGCRVIDPHRRRDTFRLATGDWFGVYAPHAVNNVFFVNRGAPVVLDSRGPGALRLYADLEDTAVSEGQQVHYSLLGVTDALDVDFAGPERYLQIARYFQQPDGLEIRRGRRLPQQLRGADAGGSFGFIEVGAQDGAAELLLPRPEQRVSLTLPVRVHGLNRRWSAGLHQVIGYTSGYYTDGRNVYACVGFDQEGAVYAALHPDMAELTHVIVGHPVVCDDDELIIEVMPRPAAGEDRRYAWHVAVNNPGTETVQATFRQAMPAPGLQFPEQTLSIAAGAYVVLGE